jgi:hypothetical protein
MAHAEIGAGVNPDQLVAADTSAYAIQALSRS